MVVEDLSLLKFGVINFFAIIMNKPLFAPMITVLTEIVKSIIEAEKKPDEKLKKRIEYIYNHTNKEIDRPLALVEIAVFKNIDKGLNKMIEFEDRGEHSISELYTALDNIRWELVSIVTGIIKEYTLEMPLYDVGSIGMKTGFGIGFSGTEQRA